MDIILIAFFIITLLVSIFLIYRKIYLPIIKAKRKKDFSVIEDGYQYKLLYIGVFIYSMFILIGYLNNMNIYKAAASSFVATVGVMFFVLMLKPTLYVQWFHYENIEGFIPNNFFITKKYLDEWYFVNDHGVSFAGPYKSPQLISPKLLFAKKEKEKYYCLINRNGQELPGKFKEDFSYYNEDESIIVMTTTDDAIYLITDYGKTLGGPFKKVIMERNNPWRIIQTLNDIYYYYDEQLKKKLGPYQQAELFNSIGIATVQKFSHNHLSIINQQGEELCGNLIKTKLFDDYIFAKSDPKETSEKLWFVVTAEGCSAKGYKKIFPFWEDKAVAIEAEDFIDAGQINRAYVYINMKGERFPGVYLYARPFEDDRAIVKQHNGWVIINEKFETLSLPYEEIRDFNNGYAVAKTNNQYYLLDINGQFAAGPYDYIWDMSDEGFARCLIRETTDGSFAYYLIHISENPRNIHKAGPFSEAGDVEYGSVTIRGGYHSLPIVILTDTLKEMCSPPIAE